MPAELPAFKVVQQLGRTYRALLSAFDINLGQPLPRWRILLALYQREERSQKDLAEDLRMDPAALTRQVKAMQRLGLIARRSDERDNRLTNVMLTAQGRKVVRQTLPQRTRFFDQLLEGLSEEDLQSVSQLLDVLEQRLRGEMSQAPFRADGG